jgi:hypothetical protein
MCKAFDHLSYGQIEDYISDEDIDDEDRAGSSDDETESESESESESEESEPNTPPAKKPREKGIPKSLLNSNLPRFAKAKRNQRKKK